MATKALKKSIGIKDVLQQVQPMIESVAGFVVGNLAVNAANKVLKIDPTNTAEKGIKRILPPLAVVGGAIFGATKVQQPMLKNVLNGAAIAGAYKTAKALMPSATFLAGDGVHGLGLTPVSAVSNTDRWLYHETTPVSGIGFPDLGSIQPPASNSGYYLDAPAYMGEAEPEQQMIPQQPGYFRGTAEEQFYGNEEELSGQDEVQIYGDDDIEIL